MRDFAIGLALGLVGTVLWVQSLLIREMGMLLLGSGHPWFADVALTAVGLGVVVMILGPVLFWFVVPLVSKYRREEDK